MKTCLHCQKEVEKEKGKREKLYCNSTCRSAHFQKSKGQKKYIQIKSHEKIVARLQKELELALAERSNPLINAARGRDENGTNKDEIRPPVGKHPLWKEGDPKEGSGGFYMKYGFSTYDEIEKSKK